MGWLSGSDVGLTSLDRKAYEAEVLVRHAVANTVPDHFERLGISPGDEVSADELDERGRACKIIWTQAKQKGRLKGLAKTLLAQHDDALKTLKDPDRRRTLVEDATRQRREAEVEDRERLAELDRMLDGLAARSTRLDPRRHSALVGRFGGEAVAERLARRGLQVFEDASEGPEPFEPARRKTIARQLAAYAGQVHAHSREDAPIRVYPTLYHFLSDFGLRWEPDQGPPPWGAMRPAIEAAVAAAQDIPHADERRKAIDDLAGQCRVLEQQQGAYDAGRRADFASALADVLLLRFDPATDAIDAETKDDLCKDARRHGLSGDEAGNVVLRLAREHGISVLGEAVGKAVRLLGCPACNEQSVARGQQDCPLCGEALFRTCPGCQARVSAATVACPNCRLDVLARGRADERLREAVQLRKDRRPGAAVERAREAASIDRAHPQATASVRALEAAVESARGRWEAVEAAVAARRHYAAREGLLALAREAEDIPSPGGSSVKAMRRVVDEHLQRAGALVDRADRPGAASEQLLLDALREVADHPEATSRLSTRPPAPARSVTATPDAAGFRLAWAASPSAGDIEYVVVRREGLAPRTVADGTETGRTRGLEARDTDAPPGTTVGYAVFAVRAGACSAPAASEVALACPAPSLELEERDGRVDLRWDRVGHGRIAVVRRAPDGVPVSLNVPAGSGPFADDGLVNGTTYEYCVTVLHVGADGRTVTSPEVRRRARPQAPPRAVEDLRLDVVARGVRLTFTPPPSGKVQVLRCERAPAVEPGRAVAPASLRGLGHALSTGLDRALDPHPVRLAWYVAVSSTAREAVTGTPVRYVSVPDVSDLEAVDLGSAVQLTWRWPEGCEEARVLWRTDAPPAAADDPRATRQDVRRAIYAQRGCRIEVAPHAERIHVLVCPGVRLEGEVLHGFGPGVPRILVARSARRVGYRVEMIGRRRKRTLRVSLLAPAGGAPELVVVHHASVLPISRDMGQAELGRLSETAPVLTVPAPVRGFVRAFPVDPAVAVEGPGPAELRIA